jgi:hypothetical protein
MSLNDDLEDCEEIHIDSYASQSTTVARARLCGQCVNYTIANRLLTCIRCTLEIRPTISFDKEQQKWVAQCQKFEKKNSLN